MHALGQGLPPNQAEAAKWYRMAAQQGLAEAQYNLGVAYYAGAGLAQSHAEAAAWFSKAAEQGYPLAQYYLGDMYAKGLGVPLDDQQAYFWLSLAAGQLSGPGQQKALARINALSGKLTPDQLWRTQEQVRQWRQPAQP
jgi:TPR repeat protein